MNKMKYLTKKQMSEVDNFAMKKYGVKSEFLMENAGKNIAEFVSKLKHKPKRVVFFIGKGNNAGDGMVAARHLSIKNFDIEIISVFNPKEMNDLAREQFNILRKIGIKISNKYNPQKGDLILDALLGYNLKGGARGRIKENIDFINSLKGSFSGLSVVSVDIPSGLDSDEDFKKQVFQKEKSIIRADYILTLALAKKSLKKIRNLYVINIGVPWKVYNELGIIRTNGKDYFNKSDIIKIS